jgi:hypothetical protein
MKLKPQRPSKGEEIRSQIMQDITDTKKELSKRLNVEIDIELYRQIKIQSAKEGRTIAEITTELWTKYIQMSK